MESILSLRASVTREQAVQLFSARGLNTVVRDLFVGPLRSVADVYLPFRVFRVKIDNSGRIQEQVLGIDAIHGTLDLYSFDPEQMETGTIEVATRNYPEARLDEESAKKIVNARVQRIVYRGGFFKVRDLKIEMISLRTIYVPYWLGFYGRNELGSMDVLDAVRRRLEGAKVRNLVRDWLGK